MADNLGYFEDMTGVWHASNLLDTSTPTLCNMLQHAATHCSTLQHTLQHTAKDTTKRVGHLHTKTHCSTLNAPQHIATHCITLQHTAAPCNTLQHTAAHCSTLWITATYCSTMQHITAPCTTLQLAAKHCKTLQQYAMHGGSLLYMSLRIFEGLFSIWRVYVCALSILWYRFQIIPLILACLISPSNVSDLVTPSYPKAPTSEIAHLPPTLTPTRRPTSYPPPSHRSTTQARGLWMLKIFWEPRAKR